MEMFSPNTSNEVSVATATIERLTAEANGSSSPEIVIQLERNSSNQNSRKRPSSIDPEIADPLAVSQTSSPQELSTITLSSGAPTSSNNNLFQHTAVITLAPRQKIPRPPNAFMLFANEWRKKLAVQFPRESNKDISVRLGGMWKTMVKKDKEKYFSLAREVDAEHKRKYPDYVYNPKEARMRKALREQSRETRAPRAHTPTNSQQHGWPKGFGRGQRQAYNNQRGLVSPRMLAEQQRSVEAAKKMFQDQVEQGLIHGYADSFLDINSAIPAYPSLPGHILPGGGDYAIVELEGQQWYSYIQNYQPQQPTPSYIRSADEGKISQGNHWPPQFLPENRSQTASPFLRQPMTNGSVMYGGNGQTSSSTNDPGQFPMHSSCQSSMKASDQQFASTFEQNSSNTKIKSESGLTRTDTSEDSSLSMPILDLTSSASSSVPTNSTLSTSKKLSIDSLPSLPEEKRKSQTLFSSASTVVSESKENQGRMEANNLPLPAFEQAFGSTEIGRYSHEGFFSSQQTDTQNQNPVPGGLTEPLPSSLPPDFSSPTFVFSPSEKVHCTDSTLLSPSSWPSLYYYSPNSKSNGISMSPDHQHLGKHSVNPMSSGFTCFGSPSHFAPPPYAYFDYALLSGGEFMGAPVDSEAVLLGPSFSGRNEIQ